MITTPSDNADNLMPPEPPRRDARPLTVDDFDHVIAVDPENVEAEETEHTVERILVRTPSSRDYFRVHPTATQVVKLIRLTGNRAFTLCGNNVTHSAARSYRIHLYVTYHSAQTGLWPILTPQHGEDYPSSKRAREIAADAITHWCAMQWDPSNGGRWKYRPFKLPGKPVWPTADLRALILRAFEHEAIRSDEDPRLAPLPNLLGD
jgi:hypothetical protein